MIYLFSQIVISLLLAAIVGGAIGWLVYRARAGKQINELHALLSRQQQQVSEAQTQVSMLTNDYDDLKQRSQNVIEELSHENQQIPALNQNLEKSQLLVNQLIAKHKSDSISLLAENKQLSEKAKLADDREIALSQLRSELDSEKRRNKKSSSDAELDSASELDSQSEPASEEKSEAQIDANPAEQVSVEAEAAADTESTPHSAPEIQSTMNFASSKIVDTQVQASFADSTTEDVQDQIKSNDKTHANDEDELEDIRNQLAEESKRSSTGIANANAQKVELPNQNIQPLFESVEQHDDLKQIFGIGPLTEKTLNKLGITSYSQLADLKRHDIEKIAEALHIVPDRIERDNWVGSARTQLEEVLENL